MSKVFSFGLLAVVLLYIVSPIDFVPGPIDDAVVALLGVAGSIGAKKISGK